jgi:hypothetical protein
MIRRLPEQMTDDKLESLGGRTRSWGGSYRGRGRGRCVGRSRITFHPFDALTLAQGEPFTFHRSPFPKIAPIGRYGILRVRPP